MGYELSQEISGERYTAEQGHIEYSQIGCYGYDLGEIAGESFNDRHGIWQNGPQIFPSQREGPAVWSREASPPRRGEATQGTGYQAREEEAEVAARGGENRGGEQHNRSTHIPTHSIKQHDTYDHIHRTGQKSLR